MANIDVLIERNKHFATTIARQGIGIIAKYARGHVEEAS